MLHDASDLVLLVSFTRTDQITDQSRCIDKGFVQYMGFDFPSKICLFVVFNYNTYDHIQVSNSKNLMLATPLDERSDHCTFYL